ncbi:MAG: PAS domain-containing protein [Candidatus Omnitrophica bacterium]|nr:PAS domain-containing protein [Candidatus Omnitrophota bacterium]
MFKTGPLKKRVRTNLIISIPLLITILIFGSQLFSYYIVKMNFLKLVDDQDVLAFHAVLDMLRQQIWMASLVAIFFGLILAYAITLPIKKLTFGANTIAHGDLTKTVCIDSEDEIGTLGRSFNSMVSYLNEHIIESMTGGVITINMKGVIVTFNKSAELILGYDSEEIVGRSIFEIFSKDSQNHEFHSIVQDTLLQKKTSSSREINIFSKTGRKVPIGITTSLLRDKKNTFLGIVVTFKDLAQIKHLEEQLRRADRLAAVGGLAAGIAHEIRNPLGSIKGLVQLLQEDMQDSAKKKAYADVIVKEVDRLNKVVEELLSFARPDESELDSNFSPHNVNDIIEQTLRLAEHDTKNTGINIVRNFSPDLPDISADAKKLQQAFLNLIFNASAAMQAEGILTLSTAYKPENSSIEVKVSDTGCGIEPEVLSKIFDPFYTTKKGGTGLGLTITHQIITAHNGKMDVKSVPGKGTTIIINFSKNLEEK